MSSQILAIDHYLPAEKINTVDLMAEVNPKRFDIADTLIAHLIGIEQVRHHAPNELPSTLAINAAQQAFTHCEIKPSAIDLIIFCGIDRDYAEPSTAHIVQDALNCNAVCFDVTNACLGFMTGIQIANEMIASGSIRYALICTGERPSEITKAHIPTLRHEPSKSKFWNQLGVLTVGDAGAAAILGPKTDDSGLLGLLFRSFGALAKLCYYKNDNGILEGQMLMKQISNAILMSHKEMFTKTLESLKIDREQIKCLVTHQVGKRPWQRYPSLLGIPGYKMTKTFDYLGNITSATFAVNYSLALQQGRLKKGDVVLAAMAGSGLSICQAGLIV